MLLPNFLIDIMFIIRELIMSTNFINKIYYICNIVQSSRITAVVFTRHWKVISRARKNIYFRNQLISCKDDYRYFLT